MTDTRTGTGKSGGMVLPVSAELREQQDAMKEFRILMQLYSAGINTVKTRLEILDEEFHAKYDYNPIHHIESRLKEPRSIFEKMQRLGLPFTLEGMQAGLSDIAGVRVICNYVSDAEKIAELLLRQDDVKLVKKSDYIHSPKKSGYQQISRTASNTKNIPPRYFSASRPQVRKASTKPAAHPTIKKESVHKSVMIQTGGTISSIPMAWIV